MALDGVAGFLQINSISFDYQQQLPNLVEATIMESDWDPMTRNELILNRIENERCYIWTYQDKRTILSHTSQKSES